MRALATAAFAAFCCILSTGCATVMTGAGPNQTIKISSNPRGAKVYVDGDYKGVTPIGVAMTRSDHHLVRLEKDGYQPMIHNVNPGWNPWQAGNILIGGLIGLSIDFIDGSFIWLGGPVDLTLQRAVSPEPVDAGLASSRTQDSKRPIERGRSRPAAPMMANSRAAAPTPKASPVGPYGGDDIMRLPPRRQPPRQ